MRIILLFICNAFKPPNLRNTNLNTDEITEEFRINRVPHIPYYNMKFRNNPYKYLYSSKIELNKKDEEDLKITHTDYSDANRFYFEQPIQYKERKKPKTGFMGLFS